MLRTAFLDSTVLVKRYVREPGHDSMRTILAHPEYQGGLFVCRTALVEVVAALHKAWRAGRLKTTPRDQAIEHFLEDFFSRFWVLPVRAEDEQSALELLYRYHKMSIGPEDALHVACALEAKRILSEGAPYLEEHFGITGPIDELTFMSSDSAQKKVARFEGFHVFDPQEERLRRILPHED